jgi:hypothetical protein
MKGDAMNDDSEYIGLYLRDSVLPLPSNKPMFVSNSQNPEHLKENADLLRIFNEIATFFTIAAAPLSVDLAISIAATIFISERIQYYYQKRIDDIEKILEETKQYNEKKSKEYETFDRNLNDIEHYLEHKFEKTNSKEYLKNYRDFPTKMENDNTRRTC